MSLRPVRSYIIKAIKIILLKCNCFSIFNSILKKILQLFNRIEVIIVEKNINRKKGRMYLRSALLEETCHDP